MSYLAHFSNYSIIFKYFFQNIVRRFRIDQSTNWQRVKVISRHEFPLAIDMSAFSEGSSSGGGGGGGGFNSNNYSNINAAIQTDKALEDELVSQLRKNTITLSHAVEVAEKWAVMIYQQCKT